MNLEISVNGAPPTTGSLEIVNEEGRLHWNGWVTGMQTMGIPAHISYILGNHFYAGTAMFLQMEIPEPGDTNEPKSYFHGGGPLDRFDCRPPLTEAEREQVAAAVRKAREERALRS